MYYEIVKVLFFAITAIIRYQKTSIEQKNSAYRPFHPELSEQKKLHVYFIPLVSWTIFRIFVAVKQAVMKDLSNSVATFSDADMREHTEELETAGFNRLWLTTRHGRRFLLKGLKPEYRGKPEFEALLRKEFELGMRLDHPSIVRIWGMEHTAEKGNCILMDYIDGEPLSEFMESHPVKAERLRIARELAESLVYIHAVGVWHRDLKPDNIMVTHSGRHIQLIDFGLGDSDNFVTFKSSGATRTFGAPEQIDEHRGDCRSDVYSFGKLMQYLHLPSRYAWLRHTCLAADPARRPTMESVLKSMKRMEKWRWDITVPVMAGTAAIAVAIMLAAPPEQDGTIPNEKKPLLGKTLPDLEFGKMNNATPESVPADKARTEAVPATDKATAETTARKIPAGQPDMEKFDKDYKEFLRRAIEEGKPYMKQHREAVRLGKAENVLDSLSMQTYNVLLNHWRAFKEKWMERGVTADELGIRETDFYNNINSTWQEVWQEP